MCLGIPMQILEINGYVARCEAKGVERTVSLMLLLDEPLQPGDFLVIQRGHATEKITPERAREAWEMYDLMAGTAGLNHPDGGGA